MLRSILFYFGLVINNFIHSVNFVPFLAHSSKCHKPLGTLKQWRVCTKYPTYVRGSVQLDPWHQTNWPPLRDIILVQIWVLSLYYCTIWPILGWLAYCVGHWQGTCLWLGWLHLYPGMANCVGHWHGTCFWLSWLHLYPGMTYCVGHRLGTCLWLDWLHFFQVRPMVYNKYGRGTWYTARSHG